MPQLLRYSPSNLILRIPCCARRVMTKETRFVWSPRHMLSPRPFYVSDYVRCQISVLWTSFYTFGLLQIVPEGTQSVCFAEMRGSPMPTSPCSLGNYRMIDMKRRNLVTNAGESLGAAVAVVKPAQHHKLILLHHTPANTLRLESAKARPVRH